MLFLKDLYDEAIADCSKSIELDNTFTKAYLRRAQLYEEKEEHFDKALEDFQAVLKQEPNNKLARESVNVLISLTNLNFKYFFIFFSFLAIALSYRGKERKNEK